MLLARDSLTETWLTEGGARPTLGIAWAIRCVRAAFHAPGFSSRSSRQLVADRLPTTDERAIWARLEAALTTGKLSVHAFARPALRVDPRVRIEPSIAPLEPPLEPPVAPEPIIEADRSLYILRCDPELGPDRPLAFEYLTRGLHGQPVELLIRSDAVPGEIVHRETLTAAQTEDRVHAGTWDGQFQGRRIPADYGPCTLELVHNSSLRDEAQFTIHRTVVLVTLDGFFHTGSAMLLPSRPARGGNVSPFEQFDDREAWSGSGPHRERPAFDQPFRPPPGHHDRETIGPTLLANILAECGGPQAGRRLLLIGHTSAAGANALNDELGDARARCVWSLLTGDADGFEAAVQEFTVLEDAYVMLRYFARMFAWDCDPGEPRATATGTYVDAVRCFQRSYNERFDASIDVDGDVGPQTRGAFFAVLEAVLAGAFGGDAQLGQYRGRLRVHGPTPTLSAGERYLAASMRPGAGIDDRRVEALLFLPDEPIPEDATAIYEGGSFTFAAWSLERESADGCAPVDATLELLEPAPAPSPGAELPVHEAHNPEDPWDFLNAFCSVTNRPAVEHG